AIAGTRLLEFVSKLLYQRGEAYERGELRRTVTNDAWLCEQRHALTGDNQRLPIAPHALADTGQQPQQVTILSVRRTLSSAARRQRYRPSSAATHRSA